MPDASVIANLRLGVEAGGHGSSSGSPVLTLISSILSEVPETGPPIIAAGGMVNGGHLAALLTLGASGAAFGTRLLLSPESLYSDVQRRAILAASSSSSVRTMAFDHAAKTMGWPSGIDGRGLRNSPCFVNNSCRMDDRLYDV
jgi:nitronate monooxygenase